MLMPSSTTAAVVVAAFHLERPTILALGFVDGSVVIYETAYLFHGAKDHQRIVEIASAKNIHTTITEAVPSSKYDCSSIFGVAGVGNQSASITSIAFVPGSECTTVSVGADGNCCVTDFTSASPSICVWSVGGYATCLSVLRISPGVSISQSDSLKSRAASTTYTAYEVQVVIGCQDGCVLLYELTGKLLAKRSFEGNARIVDVEWLSALAESNGNIDTAYNVSQPTPYPLQTAFAHAYALAECVDARAATFVSELTERSDKSKLTKQDCNAVERIAGTGNSALRQDQGPRRPSPPEVPPRPMPREGGQRALRYAKAGRVADSCRENQPGLLNGKSKITLDSTVQADISSTATYKEVPDGDSTSDRNMSTESNSSEKKTIKSRNTTSPNIGKLSLRTISSILPRTGSRNRASVSHKVSTSTPTEKFIDTVIDWTAASARRQTVPPKMQPGLKKTKGGYQLNRSNHHDTEPQSIASDDTIIDWNPPLRPRKAINIHQDVEFSPAAVRTLAPKRSITARRKLSTPVSALSMASFNPKGSATRKASTNPKQQVTRRSSRQQTAPSPGGAARVTTGAPGIENDGAMTLQALVELKFSMLQHDVIKNLLAQIQALEREIAKQFDSQKDWMMKIMRDQDDWARKLEEENRMLRDELRRERMR